MIYALHGFLGLASDFDFLKPHIKSLEAEDLWESFSNHSLREWAERKSLEFDLRFKDSSEPRILLGYSMGGRLAMHLLLARPKLWSAAILVSANPGVSSIDERMARMDLDFKWSQKFLKSEWNHVVREWQEQSIFKVKKPLPDQIKLEREESYYDRKTLADALMLWSLSKQDNLALKMMSVSAPVLWVAGEDDEKYCDLLCGFPQVASSHQFHKITQASHRCPWDNPQEFIRLVCEFLKALEK